MVHRRLSDGDLDYDRDRLGCPGGREPRARSHAQGHVDRPGGRKCVLAYDHRGSGTRDIRVSAPMPVHGQSLGMSGGGQDGQRYKQQSHGFSSVDGDSVALRLQQMQQARRASHLLSALQSSCISADGGHPVVSVMVCSLLAACVDGGVKVQVATNWAAAHQRREFPMRSHVWTNFR